MIQEILKKKERTKRVLILGVKETIANLEQRNEQIQQQLAEERAKVEKEKDETRRVKEEIVQA